MSQTIKQVTFHASAKVRRTLHINDYSKDEISSTWYNKQELDFIKVENQCYVHMLSNSCSSNCSEQEESNNCLRGLEAISDVEFGKQKLANRTAAWEAVLDEQDYQYFEGINEPEMLSLVYFECSYHCQLAAYARARDDEREVQQPYHELHEQLAKLLQKQGQNRNRPGQKQRHRSHHICSKNVRYVATSRAQKTLFSPAA